MSTAKEKYKAFIRENYVPIFYRGQYLDAVCDGKWDVVLYEEEGQITAIYIYMLKQKWSLRYIIQPRLCPYTGPLFFNPSDTQKAYVYLIKNLPKHHLLIQDYFHSIPILDDSVGEKKNKITYLIDRSVDIDSLWQQNSSKHRRIIRKAEKDLKYEIEDNVEVFLDFVDRTFRKRGKTVSNYPKVFQRLDNIIQPMSYRKIVKCTNENDVVVAMAYFINDEKWTYNFANGVIDDYSHFGMNLIMWNEIKATLSTGRSFDFEGSMIPGIEAFFKRFRGSKTNYQSWYYSSNWMVDLLVKLKTSRGSQ